MHATRSSDIVCFGPFNLDLRAGELHRNGRKVRLHEQPFKILEMLLEHPGEVVTRQEIRSKLWPNDTIVEFDHSINAAIKKVRLALEDSAEEPEYVETVARRGYRLKVPVDWVESSPAIAGVFCGQYLEKGSDYRRAAGSPLRRFLRSWWKLGGEWHHHLRSRGSRRPLPDPCGWGHPTGPH